MFPHLDSGNFFLILNIPLFFTAGKLLFVGSGDRLIAGNKSLGIAAILLGLYISFWFGARSTEGYGDTVFYALSYNQLDLNDTGETGGGINLSSEWFFHLIQVFCKSIGMSDHGFLTVISFTYVMSAVLAARKFDPTSPMLCTLFIFSSLMFQGFGLNGIRNGMACHLLLLALAYLLDDKKIIAGIIAFLCLGIHRTTLLPIAAIMAGMTVMRNPRWAFYCWLLSIPVSLVAGGFFTALFMGLGFDDRMTTYAGGELKGQDEFSSTGFRWDFLMYSALPIAFYWYVNIVKKLRDGWYNVIAVCYMLCNAFWVIVIRAEFSNRFAYLSWFMYPLMFAYPLANMKIWDNQDRKAGLILVGYYGITLGLYKFVWHYI